MNAKSKRGFVFVGLLASLPIMLLMVGCSPQPQNLAGQIGPITTTIDSYTSAKGQAMQRVRFKFKNNGPVEVGVVHVRMTALDVDENKIDGNVNGKAADYCIFAAGNRSERIKPGQEYETPTGHGFSLFDGVRLGKPIVSIEATVTRAEEVSGLEPASQ